MKHIIVGTAGHVDHGKTALIKALTDYDCDTHPEEKKRGITINLGFTNLKLPSENQIGIIDVPGHKDFIHTMVSGASGIDLVLLVIAADSGIMPQTKEHLNIIKSLNIQNGIIALTKCDLVDEETIEIAKLEITDLVKNHPLKDAPVIEVSATTGKGLENIIQALDNMIKDIEPKHNNNFFRLYIDRIFTVKGIGSVITGTVLNGSARTGDMLYLLPENSEKIKIKSIERHGKKVNKVTAGDRAAFNISGLTPKQFKKGMLLSSKHFYSTTMLDAYISLHEDTPDLFIWSDVLFYSSTIECQAKMHLLNADKISSEETAIVQIHLSKPSVIISGDRFIIRNTSFDKTYGGGIVLDHSPLHHKTRTDKVIKKLEILKDAILNANISELIFIELDKANQPLTDTELCELLNLKPDYLKNNHIDNPKITQYSHAQNNIYITRDNDQKFRNKILSELKDYHNKNALLSEGMEAVEFYGKTNIKNSKTAKIYIDKLIESMQEEHLIKKHKNTFILYNHNATIDDRAKENTVWLENIILNYDLQKPVMQDIESLSLERKISRDELYNYLKYLVQHGKIIHYNSEYLHKNIVDSCRNKLIDYMVKNPVINISEFRQALKATKKICPVLIGIYENEKIIKTKPIGTNLEIEITEIGKKLIK